MGEHQPVRKATEAIPVEVARAQTPEECHQDFSVIGNCKDGTGTNTCSEIGEPVITDWTYRGQQEQVSQ